MAMDLNHCSQRLHDSGGVVFEGTDALECRLPTIVNSEPVVVHVNAMYFRSRPKSIRNKTGYVEYSWQVGQHL